MRYAPLLLTPLLLLFLVTGCKPTRSVESGEHLIAGTRLRINENSKIKYEGEVEALEAVIKQKPYRKIGGILPFHISVYNWASHRNQERKLWAYLTNTVGEAPTLYEPVLLERSREQMLKALQNEGYFDAEVYATALLGKKRAELEFYVYTGEPYLI